MCIACEQEECDSDRPYTTAMIEGDSLRVEGVCVCFIQRQGTFKGFHEGMTNKERRKLKELLV